MTDNPYNVLFLCTGNSACSKSWEEFAEDCATTMNFVFTVCDSAAAETCPVWPGQPMTAHWGEPDRAAAEGKEAADVD